MAIFSPKGPLPSTSRRLEEDKEVIEVTGVEKK
jgi:hypothetical protein